MRAINRNAALSCVLALVLASAVIGCGSAEKTAGSETAHARAYTIEHLKARLGSFEWLPPRYRSGSDLLGNVRFAEGDREPEALTQAVVVGTISAVEPGVGFAPPDSGVEGRPFYDGIMVPFDSEDALWRTVHLTLDVDEALSGDVASDAKQVKIGLAIGNTNTDVEHIQDGLIALGQTVWFLQRDRWPGFSYEPSLYSDIEGGRLIAQVKSDNSLVFPMLEEGPSAQVLRGTTLAELREAAGRPPRTVQLRQEGNIWIR